MILDDGDEGLGRRATRSIGWIVAERWSSRLLMLGVFAVLTRLLPPDAFGLISLASAFMAIMQVFVDSGFSKALIQRDRIEAVDASTAFWTSLGMSAVLSLLVVLAAPALADAFDEPGLADVLPVLALALPITALSQTPAALLERELGFKTLSIRQSIGTIAGAAVALPVALLGGGVWALVAQSLGTAAVAVVVLWTSTTWRPRFEYSFASLRGLWTVGVSVLGMELLDAVQANVDKIVVGAFFSATELGYYYVAQRLGTILVELVTSVIARVSLTTFSKVQDDLPRLNRIFRQMTFAASAVSFPIFFLVAALADQVVPFVFGGGWEQAVPILWVLAPGWALGTAMYFDRSVMVATGHAQTAFWLALAQSVASIALVFALVPLGLLGVALSRWARVVLWPVRLWLLRRYIDLPVWRYVGQVARCLVAVIPVAGAVMLLQPTPWAQSDGAFWTFAVPAAVVGGAVYVVLLLPIAGDENRRALAAAAAPIARALARRRPRTAE